MKEIKLITTYDCLIKTETSSIELCKNESVKIDNEKFIDVYPIDKSNKISFQIKLDNLTENQFYQCYEDNDKIYICLLNGNKCSSYYSHAFANNTPSPNVELGDGKVTFNSYPYKKVIEFSKDYKDFSCHKLYNIMYALLRGKEKYLLIAMNIKNGKIKMFKGKTISLEKNGFTVIQNFDNLAQHKIKSKYKISKEGLKRIEHEILYANTVARTISINEGIPYAFLEAIKVEDYTLALSYLSESLKVKVDTKLLKKCFGKVVFYFEMEKNKFFIKTEQKPLTAIFDIKNSKILDIDIQ